MRILIFGYHNIGYFCLKELLNVESIDIVGIVTHVDNPDENIWFNSVCEIGFENNIQVYQPEDVNDPSFVGIIRDLQPDIIFSFYFRQILSAEILKIPTKGCMNLHGSYLPKYRGRCPINWVLVNGENETGVSLHYMEEKPDVGDIIAQRKVKIDEDDTTFTLFGKMVSSSVILIRETYPLIESGNIDRIPQIHKDASFYGGRKPDDGIIDWNKSATEIYNLIRAVTHPYPGAFTFFNGKKVYVWLAKVQSSSLNSIKCVPGFFKSVSDEGIIISTREDDLLIISLQIADEEEINALQFTEKYNLKNEVIFKKRVIQ